MPSGELFGANWGSLGRRAAETSTLDTSIPRHIDSIGRTSGTENFAAGAAMMLSTEDVELGRATSTVESIVVVDLRRNHDKKCQSRFMSGIK